VGIEDNSKLCISFFIGMLNIGGAERQLVVLAKGLAECGHRVSVFTIFPGGKNADELSQYPDVKLQSLWPNRSSSQIVRIVQLIISPMILRKLVKDSDAIYSMLEITNFIAWLATRFRKKPSLIWGIRSSNMEGHWKMALFDKLCALVSPTISLVVANSYAGLECLLSRGYNPQKHLVIPNGIDTDRFQFDGGLRKKIRQEIGISSDQLLIGIVGRLNLMKDHQTFLSAAALVAKEIADVRFVCVGGGRDDYVKKLQEQSKTLGLDDRVFWLGEREDMRTIYSSLDMLVSSSYGEGFPNVIGEAMACGVPCVVTDVGDSAMIVGCSECVVPPRDPRKLADAIIAVAESSYSSKLSVKYRKQIIENFSVGKMISSTAECFEKKLC